MIKFKIRPLAFLSILVVFLLGYACTQQNNLGMFEGNTDIGKIQIPGSVKYDAGTDSYRIAGSGENMWFNEDALHYVWKQVSGDVLPFLEREGDQYLLTWKNCKSLLDKF